MKSLVIRVLLAALIMFLQPVKGTLRRVFRVVLAPGNAEFRAVRTRKSVLFALSQVIKSITVTLLLRHPSRNVASSSVNRVASGVGEVGARLHVLPVSN